MNIARTSLSSKFIGSESVRSLIRDSRGDTSSEREGRGVHKGKTHIYIYIGKGLQPNIDGLQPNIDGLQPNIDGLQLSSNGLQLSSDGLQPRAGCTNLPAEKQKRPK